VKTKLPARPGLDVILPYLKEKGYRLGIASGSERRVVDNNLQSSGLGHYFAASLCGDEVSHGKPHPESYMRVAEMIGKKPAECFVLEDSPNGILSAYRAGCAPIMIPNDVQPDQATRDMCAGVFSSLNEVVDALESGQLS
jgi:HAD superfamily hydrolase (TIGR01509 family)